MEKINRNGLDLTQCKIEKLKRIFPDCVCDGKIDFDILKTILGDYVENNSEKYSFNWIGKNESLKYSQLPSTGTLIPIKEKSLNWDFTNNLYIEGDNLEVLKVISKTYHNKIKVIFIDPPYNTGEDRVYHDNFEKNIENYLDLSDQALKANPDTAGRFHTDWLNLMYPRLKLAYEMLSPDGAIFISIDDHEINNMMNVCNIVFGQENFVGNFIWEKKKKPSFLNKNIGKLNDYIVCYVKNSEQSIPFSVETTTQGKKYPLNNAGNTLATLHFPKGSVKFNIDDCEIEPQDMSEGNIITRLLTRLIIRDGVNDNDFDLEGEWRYSQDKLNDIIKNNEEIIISKIPFRPNHVKAGGEIKKMSNFLTRSHYNMETNEDATQQLISLFGKDVFNNPKPVKLIKSLIQALTYDDKDCVVMDFFSGSGTTAQAVLELNAEDNGSRKFILVQLPEDLDNNLTQSKLEEKQTIINAIAVCDEIGTDHKIVNIGEERIRRVCKKIKNSNHQSTLFVDSLKDLNSIDLGFKVFKLDSSNIKPWDPTAKYDENNLVDLMSVIKEDRTNLDVAYEVMLKYGVFNMPLEEIEVNGKTVYSVGYNYMIISLNDNITSDDVLAIAKLSPKAVVFKEKGFKDDNEKINADYTFKRLGIDNVKCI